MSFIVYVLHSKDYDKIYSGYSSDPEARLASHNHLSRKGWTIRYRPWTLIHTETFATKAEAMKREKELKSTKGREFTTIKSTLASLPILEARLAHNHSQLSKKDGLWTC